MSGKEKARGDRISPRMQNPYVSDNCTHFSYWAKDSHPAKDFPENWVVRPKIWVPNWAIRPKNLD